MPPTKTLSRSASIALSAAFWLASLLSVASIGWFTLRVDVRFLLAIGLPMLLFELGCAVGNLGEGEGDDRRATAAS